MKTKRKRLKKLQNKRRRQLLKKLIIMVSVLFIILFCLNVVILFMIAPVFKNPTTGQELSYQPYVAINLLFIGVYLYITIN